MENLLDQIDTKEQLSLLPIMFLRFISTITFGVFYSSLSLLMTKSFNFSNEAAASITALFFAFHYSLPMMGGKLGDNLSNFKQVFISGKLFQLLSSFVLIYSISHQQYLFLGLGLFLVDSMVSVVSLNMLITNRFDQSSTDQRGLAFLKGHVWSNYGFIAAFFLSGAISYYVELKYLFYISALFSVLTIIYSYAYIKDNMSNNKLDDKFNSPSSSKIILFMFAVAGLATLLLSQHSLTSEIVLLSAVAAIIGIFFKSTLDVTQKEKEGIITFLLFMICSVAFWSIYMLGPTFLPIFIQGGVDTTIMGVTIPPQWFHIVCPLTTVTVGLALSRKLGSVMNKRNTGISRVHLFALGLLCTSLALLILYYIVDKHAFGIHSNCLWLILYIIVLAIGEIFLAPASMALIGDYIPKKYQGIYTGVNQMTIGLSVIFSGLILQNLLLPAYELDKQASIAYIHNFIYLSFFALTIGMLLFIFDKRFKNKMALN